MVTTPAKVAKARRATARRPSRRTIAGTSTVDGGGVPIASSKRGDAKNVGGLVDSQIKVEAQHDHGSLPLAQRAEQLPQGFAVFHAIGRGEAAIGQPFDRAFPAPRPASFVEPVRVSIRWAYASTLSIWLIFRQCRKTLLTMMETRSSAVCQSLLSR